MTRPSQRGGSFDDPMAMVWCIASQPLLRHGMKVRLIAIGERPPAWISQGFNDYRQRLARWMHRDLIEIAPGRRTNGPVARAINTEGCRVLARMTRQNYVVALDGTGQAWSSADIAVQVEKWKMRGQDICLLIGGPDGHDPTVLARATERWSLGPLTFPHFLVRLLVVEQIYRAASLNANHPYHRA